MTPIPYLIKQKNNDIIKNDEKFKIKVVLLILSKSTLILSKHFMLDKN